MERLLRTTIVKDGDSHGEKQMCFYCNFPCLIGDSIVSMPCTLTFGDANTIKHKSISWDGSFLLDNVQNFTSLPHVAKWVPHFMHVCFLHCKNKLVILTMEWLLQLQTNWREWLREVCMLWYCSSSYNHNLLTTLRTSVRELPACTKSKKVPYCNFETHL